MRIVWIGCHSEGLKAFRAILEKGYRIEKFITLNGDAFEKRSGGSREYIDICRQYHVPVSYVTTIKNDEAYNEIKEVKPDLMIVLGWSEILPEKLLDIPTIGTVGTHAALLPHNRGSAPINWALIKGETSSGNSLMWLDKNVDQGAIIDQIGFEISMFDTCKTLYDKVADTNMTMLLRLIERMENGTGTVMNKENITDEPLLPRRRPKDGLLNWNQNSKAIYDFIRALTRPYPGAFSYLAGKKYFIWNASLLPGKERGEPGIISGPVFSPDEHACGIMVQCMTGNVIIHEMEDEDGNVFVGRKLAEMDINGVFRNEE